MARVKIATAGMVRRNLLIVKVEAIAIDIANQIAKSATTDFNG